MVHPGEVDQDLEPEIKEECHSKYGDVNKVMIYEIPNTTPEEAVRIFIEFKSMNSAIKGMVYYLMIYFQICRLLKFLFIFVYL